MELSEYILPVGELCKKYKVHRLYVFGSVLTDRFNDRSDIDIYVEYWMRNIHSISGLRRELMRVFNRNIDLHTTQLKRADYRLLYEGELCTNFHTFALENYIMGETNAPVTVALPVWNAKDICWLSMESLCRQTYPFELIVFEERHKNQLGRDWFFSWKDRLKECTRIVYLTADTKFTLAEKWCAIADYAESEVFCLWGCDDWADPDMCRDAHESIKNGYQYAYETKGYFYHIKLKKMILYDIKKYKGLMQCVPTDKMKKITPIKKSSGVDRWIHDAIRPRKVEMRTGMKQIVCTDGFNNISKRTPFYSRPGKPFYETDKTLHDILPKEIVKRLLQMR